MIEKLDDQSTRHGFAYPPKQTLSCDSVSSVFNDDLILFKCLVRISFEARSGLRRSNEEVVCWTLCAVLALDWPQSHWNVPARGNFFFNEFLSVLQLYFTR